MGANASGKTIVFSYNEDGSRASKTVNGTRTDYIYNGSKVMRETSGGVAIDFIYDADGRPFAMKRNGAYYYYILNLQGDVIRLVNSSGATVASYEYDPYGKVISATGSMAAINPLRYRGYYYDQETGLYFLMSRYYDPAICRFINADSFASTGQGILGYNMFAYCRNNPVNMSDSSGYWPMWIKPTADDIKEFFETVEGFIIGALINLTSSHNLNRRPNRGEPGSVFVAPNGDKRYYGPDGLPERDYDHGDHGEKDKPRDKDGGHYHDWDWTKENPRGDAYAIGGIGIVSGILLLLEFLLVYSVY